MPEEVESIAVIEVGDATSLLATIEDRLHRELRKVGANLNWQVKSGLDTGTFKQSSPGQPYANAGGAVFVWLEGAEGDLERACKIIETAARQYRRTVRFLGPDDTEFKQRKRMSFADQ